ncbi:OLC1v1023264C5 [Oldenlandia corymbosa var. corymbosa]|uniref:Alpha-1,3/1,6-mannosyltransferase ALG2 n=1 Tax=Oldenlandia corymbosa var. corymbosa TaxID=529605 RepID=A0AAV1C180_OLDCO|nr:OLC1v1023264C5 [Oldenlandia corymbosa var. corymbosa]
MKMSKEAFQRCYFGCYLNGGSFLSLFNSLVRLEEEQKMEKSGNSKLNVAIIHPDLGIGGAERLIVDAAVELASLGHNVHVFTSHHDKTRCFEETVSGIFPVTVYGSFLPRHIFYRLHAVCAYLRCIFVAICVLLLWRSFDVILVDQVSAVIPVIKLKKSTKVVFYCHFPDLLLAQHTTVLRRLYRMPIDLIEQMTTGMADLILVNSKFTASTFARTFKNLDARGIKPAVLYPAVNLDQFKEPNAIKLNFLSINRFERKKNIELAISAFAMLHTLEQDVLQGAVLADASLTIAGGYDKRLRENVDYLEELKSLAAEKGVSHRVKFITSCSTSERNALLSECLCILYTPMDEHFGIVPLEAMASCKPVIACNSGGPVETVKNGVTGFLCDPSPQDFSLAMAKLIRDPEMAERMGREARQHVAESFSTKIFGQKLHRYLVDVVKGKEE